MSSPDQYIDLKKQVINAAFNRGLRTSQITPDMQYAPWLKEGIQTLENNEKLTGESVINSEKRGGTDHPDPTI